MSNIFENENIVISPTVVSRDKIENLSDRPNLAVTFGGDGMTANDLKKSFDKIGVYIATRLKNLIDALKTSDAGASIGITDWDGETATTIKECLDKLKTSLGASIIGTGKSIEGANANLQEVIDDLYAIITNYELDDISDIKTSLGYVDASGECETFNLAKEDILELKEVVEKLKTLLSVNVTLDRSTRLENVESDVADINDSLGEANGIATLNNSGKVSQEIDASKITSGTLPLSVIPDAAFERTVIVESEAEMYALTITQVQNGDIVVIQGTTDRWFKVVYDTKLSESNGYREIIGGTTAIAQMAKEYDPNFSGANSIYSKITSLEGEGRSTQNIKKNADDIIALAGSGRTTETVKGNADAISELTLSIASVNSSKVDKTLLKHLECTHSKSGTVHTFTLNSGNSFLPNVTEYSIRAKMTANIDSGDTITLTDGTTTYSGILPKDSAGKSFKVAFSSGIYPIIDFTVDLGGSEKHAFFKSGGNTEVGDITFENKSSDDDYAQLNGTAQVDYYLLSNEFKNKMKFGFGLGVKKSETLSSYIFQNKLFGNRLVRVGAPATNAYSFDGGETWTHFDTSITFNAKTITFFNGLYYIFFSASGSANNIYVTTADFITFNQHTFAISCTPFESCVKFGKIYVVAYGYILYSSDGESWTTISTTTQFGSANRYVEANTEGDKLVFFQIDGGWLYVTTDGTNFTRYNEKNTPFLMNVGIRCLYYEDGYYYFNGTLSSGATNTRFNLVKTTDFVNYTTITTNGLKEYSGTSSLTQYVSSIIKYKDIYICFREDCNISFSYDLVNFVNVQCDSTGGLIPLYIFGEDLYMWKRDYSGNYSYKLLKLRLLAVMENISALIKSSENIPYVKYK